MVYSPETAYRFDVETEEDSGKWCFCKDRGGDMIGWDGKLCQMKWFHLTCLGMSESSIYTERKVVLSHMQK